MYWSNQSLPYGCVLVVTLAAFTFCSSCSDREETLPEEPALRQPAGESKEATRALADEDKAADSNQYRHLRRQMVEEQLAGRDITNQRVLEAMAEVPRHKFVPPGQERTAYLDSALPIGEGQTISQPYVVALMTQLVDPQPDSKALDVGTGSGYQAAVLGEIVDEVYSIEIIESLAEEARARLQALGYENVHVRHGDGYRGWPDQAPFDVIIVAAAPDEVPEPLVEQLAKGGKMVIPVGNFFQRLLLIEKAEDGSVSRKSITPVRFVPMTGEAQE